jgi:hypothetical protein
MVAGRGVYTVLVGKPEGKKQLGIGMSYSILHGAEFFLRS